jgi:hypothetical protein
MAKTVWDKVAVLGTIATPILVAALGFLFSKELADREAMLQQNLEAIRSERHAADQHIEQSQLLITLIQPLTDPDPTKRTLAVNIAIYALGETGRTIVEAVSLSDPDSSIRSYAVERLSDRRGQLIQGLVADDRTVRWNSAEELATAWAGDPQLVPELLRFGTANQDDNLALYNVTVVLADLPPSALGGFQREIGTFLDMAVTKNPRTSAKADSVRVNLRRVRARIVN